MTGTPGLWRSLSIPARLVAVCTAALLLSATLVTYTHVSAEVAAHREELLERADSLLEFLVPAVTEQAVIGDYTMIDRMLASRARRQAIERLSWIDERGHAIRSNGPAIQVLAPPWFERWTGLQEVERRRQIQVGGAPYGEVLVRLSPIPAINGIWRESVQALELMLAGTVILVGLVVLVVSRSLRPLFRLAGGAQRFGSGDYSLRVSEEGPPEMIATAIAFNTMAENLERAVVSLRESDARNRLLAAIASQSRDAIVTTDLEGRITSWNAAAETIFKYQSDEVLGRPISLIHPTWMGSNPSDMLEKIQSGRSQSYETQRVARDGSLVSIAISVSPQHDEQGRHVGEISVIRDITERKLAERAYRDEQERVRVTLDSIADGVIRVDAQGRVEYLNPVAERMTGWSQADARGRMLEDIVVVVREADGTRTPVVGDPGEAPSERVRATESLILICRDGTRHPVEQVAAPIRDASGKANGFVIALRDVGESRQLASQLTWQATHDALTGLLNRQDFERRLGALVEAAEKRGSRHALLCLDLDQFKVVNDTCGHVAGDEMLRQIAALLQNCLRESDTLARLGGDEFGILLERCSVDQAEVVAEKLRSALLDYRFAWDSNTFAVSVSIGIAGIDGGGETSAAILGAADAACFSAKDLGRNRIQVARPDDAELAKRRSEMQWVSRITRAIEERRFRLWAQVIAPVTPRQSCGAHYEVLLRMIDEEGKVVPPMAFIPAAERYNLMPAIDRHVIQLTFAHLASVTGGFASTGCPRVAINLSGASFGDPAFLGFVKDQLERSGIPRGHVCFEVTETAAIAHLSRAVEFITEMKALGCLFALDDFGSGFSSFAYLKNLPVDFLKIDGSFVKDMATDPVDCAMVEAVNKLGHVMGVQTIAEFVENDLTLGMLKTLGVDYAQGYGVARPSPIEEAIAPQHVTPAPGGSPAAALAEAA